MSSSIVSCYFNSNNFEVIYFDANNAIRPEFENITVSNFVDVLNQNSISVEVLQLKENKPLRVYFDIDVHNVDEVDFEKIFELTKKVDCTIAGYYIYSEELDEKLFDLGLTEEFIFKDSKTYYDKNERIFFSPKNQDKDGIEKPISFHVYLNYSINSLELMKLRDYVSYYFKYDTKVYNATQNVRCCTSNKPECVKTTDEKKFVAKNNTIKKIHNKDHYTWISNKQCKIPYKDIIPYTIIQNTENTKLITFEKLIEIMKLKSNVVTKIKSKPKKVLNKETDKVIEINKDIKNIPWEDCFVPSDKSLMLHYFLGALIEFDRNKNTGVYIDGCYHYNVDTETTQHLAHYISVFRKNSYFEEELYINEFSQFYHTPSKFCQPVNRSNNFDIEPIQGFLNELKFNFQIMNKEDITLDMLNESIEIENEELRKKKRKLIPLKEKIDDKIPKYLSYMDLKKLKITNEITERMDEYFKNCFIYINKVYRENWSVDQYIHYKIKNWYEFKRSFCYVKENRTWYRKEGKYNIIPDLDSEDKMVKGIGTGINDSISYDKLVNTVEYPIFEDIEGFEKNELFNYCMQKPENYEDNIKTIEMILKLLELNYKEEDRTWFKVMLTHFQKRLKNKYTKTPFNFIHVGDSHTAKSFTSFLLSKLYITETIIKLSDLDKQQNADLVSKQYLLIEENIQNKSSCQVIQFLKTLTEAFKVNTRKMFGKDGDYKVVCNFDFCTNDMESCGGLFDEIHDREANKNRYIIFEHQKVDEEEYKKICKEYDYEFKTIKTTFDYIRNLMQYDKEFAQSFRYYFYDQPYFIEDHESYFERREEIPYNKANEHFTSYEREFFTKSKIYFPSIDYLNGSIGGIIEGTDDFIIKGSTLTAFNNCVKDFMISNGDMYNNTKLDTNFYSKILGKNFVKSKTNTKYTLVGGEIFETKKNTHPIIKNISKYCSEE